jgi:hypothetical protein
MMSIKYMDQDLFCSYTQLGQVSIPIILTYYNILLTGFCWQFFTFLITGSIHWYYSPMFQDTSLTASLAIVLWRIVTIKANLCQRLKGGFERPSLLASLVGLFDG